MSLTLLALLIEAAFGYPPALLARIGHPVIWIGAAIDALDRAHARWPAELEACVGLRVPLERFEEAFAFGGVKATLQLGEP